MEPRVESVLAALHRAMEGADVDWYLFGAQAALVRGAGRFTKDVDITAFSAPEGIDALTRHLLDEGFEIPPDSSRRILERTRVLPVIHGSTRIPVDIVLGGSGLEEYFLHSAETISMGEIEVRVPRAEHLIVMKAIAARPKDIEDAVEMLIHGDVDRSAVATLIDKVCEGLGDDGPRDAWRDVLREAKDRSG